MRHQLLSASIGALLLAAPLVSHAAVDTGNGDLFINGSIGSSHTDIQGLTKKDDTAYGANFGYRWNDTWGLEAGYVDLGKPEAKNFLGYEGINARLHVTGWTLGANGKFNFAQNWFVSARVGLFFSQTKGSLEGIKFNVTDHDTNAYVGVGAGYNFNRHFSIGINFDRYEAKAKDILTHTNNPYMLSGTAEYRFGI